jgi:hypothetical protein
MIDIGNVFREINVIKERTQTRENNSGKNLEDGEVVLVLGI